MNSKRNRTGSTSMNSEKQSKCGQSSVTNKKKKSGPRARWTPEFKCRFLEILRDRGAKNNAKLPWENIINDLKAEFPLESFETRHVKQLHRDLKKKASNSSNSRTPDAFQIHPNCSWYPFNRLNCLLHEVYGARGASENHQGPGSSAEHHSSSDNSLTDNQHGGVSVSLGNHQLPGSSSAFPSLQPQCTYMEEEKNGTSPELTVSDWLDIFSDTEQFQNQNVNNTNLSYDQTLATNILLQDQANSSGHVSNIAGTRAAVPNSSCSVRSSVPSIQKCISEVDRLLQTDELLPCDQRTKRDEWDAGEIFKDKYHRELYFCMDKIERIIWLRKKIYERRNQHSQ